MRSGLTLTDAPGVETLPVRTGAASSPTPTRRIRRPAAAAIDGHLWLDPENAIAFARAIAAALAAADPEHAAAYAANADAFAAETGAEEQEVAARLAPLRGRPFLVFHDAYQYFEHRFDLPAAGSIELQDGVTPGTARVAAIRDAGAEGRHPSAPSPSPSSSRSCSTTVIEGTPRPDSGCSTASGRRCRQGPALYPALLEGVAASLEECLGG